MVMMKLRKADKFAINSSQEDLLEIIRNLVTANSWKTIATAVPSWQHFRDAKIFTSPTPEVQIRDINF